MEHKDGTTESFSQVSALPVRARAEEAIYQEKNIQEKMNKGNYQRYLFCCANNLFLHLN